MSWNIGFDQLELMSLVFVRLSGLVLFNPLFARRNVPARVRMGFVLALTFLLYPGVDPAPIAGITEIEMIFAMFREIIVGACCNFVFILFYYLLYFAGDLMDMQFGLSMAKVFDPATSVQASVSGNLLTLMFLMYILATDSHLLMLRIFASSWQIVPVGAAGLSGDIAGFMLELFISVFQMAIQLTLPFVAAEFVLELSMGVLMKLIPQIHVFVINIQFKMLLGMFLLLTLAAPISNFLDRYTAVLFRNMENALFALAG